jgi:hypothetical protein
MLWLLVVRAALCCVPRRMCQMKDIQQHVFVLKGWLCVAKGRKGAAEKLCAKNRWVAGRVLGCSSTK